MCIRDRSTTITSMKDMRTRAEDFRLGRWLPDGVPPYSPHIQMLDKAYTFLEFALALHDMGIFKYDREALAVFSRSTSPGVIGSALARAKQLSEDPSFRLLSTLPLPSAT